MNAKIETIRENQMRRITVRDTAGFGVITVDDEDFEKILAHRVPWA